MVKVKSRVFNYISGKSDGKVYRHMNGETFYSIRPDTYNISQSKKAIESRNNFALAVKFTKEVNKHPALKLVWKRAKLKGTTSYHRIIKHNIKFIKENRLSVFNMIAPEGEYFPLKSYVISDDSIILDLTSSATTQSSLFQFPFSLLAVVYLYEPKKESFEDNLLFSFSTDFSEALSNDSNSIAVTIPENILSYFSRYKNCKIYFSVVFQNPNSSKLLWTSTFVIEFVPL
jgi:hypothetical protein